MSASTFQNIFQSKDGVLVELTEFMFSNQFDTAYLTTQKNVPPVMAYAVETCIQLTLTELNENLREIYLEAYAHPRTVQYIQQHTAQENQHIFQQYLPEATTQDFSDLEIGTAGIMCAYMAHPCDAAFPLEKKLERFLRMSLSAYCVPAAEQEQVIGYILQMDIRSIAEKVMGNLFQMLAMRFDFSLPEPTT